MRYMGSKRRIAKDLYLKINELTPRNGRPWVEPFGGGMNMISSIPEAFGSRYANDSNKYLIAMFNSLIDGWEPPTSISKKLYDECENLQHNDKLIGWVGFTASFRGKFFGGYNGSPSDSRNYQKESMMNIKNQLSNLIGVKFISGSYDEMYIPENSVVYCDPPYLNATQYKDVFDHDKFWDWARNTSLSHDVFVSEYSAPYDFNCVLEILINSNINGKKSIPKIEKLFKWKNANKL